MTDFTPTSTKPFPLIKDFLDFCGKDIKTEAINAVSIVKKTAERLGQYASVDFENMALHSVINRYGGWVEIVCWGEKEWSLHERNFISAYEAAKKSNLPAVSHLPGLCEKENSLKGLTYEKPFRIEAHTGKMLSIPKPINEIMIENK